MMLLNRLCKLLTAIDVVLISSASLFLVTKKCQLQFR